MPGAKEVSGSIRIPMAPLRVPLYGGPSCHRAALVPSLQAAPPLPPAKAFAPKKGSGIQGSQVS